MYVFPCFVGHLEVLNSCSFVSHDVNLGTVLGSLKETGGLVIQELGKGY